MTLTTHVFQSWWETCYDLMSVAHFHCLHCKGLGTVARGFWTAQCNTTGAERYSGHSCFRKSPVQKSFVLLFQTPKLPEDLVTVQSTELRPAFLRDSRWWRWSQGHTFEYQLTGPVATTWVDECHPANNYVKWESIIQQWFTGTTEHRRLAGLIMACCVFCSSS